MPLSLQAYFNSRPCERGDATEIIKKLCEEISIHAPARGATHPLAKGADPHSISIHAPARGATCSRVYPCFAIRPISIHAPARGATALRCAAWARSRFQFTPLREGRLPARTAILMAPVFQFTPLREGRRRAATEGRKVPHFNSRPCERGDLCNLRSPCRILISIHAPARGATGSAANL